MNKALHYWDELLTHVIHIPFFFVSSARSFSIWMQSPSVLEQSLLLKRLGMMLESGLPIGSCLHLLIEEGTTKTKQARLQTVVTLVESGVTLNRAMQQGQYQLSIFAQNLIRIGETLGTLPENLAYVAAALKAKHELRKQIIQSMIYPAIIIVATIGISVFLVVVIFPKIIPIFQSVHSTLPWSTRSLMVMSYILSHYGLLIIALIPFMIMFFWWVQQFIALKRATARAVLRLPIMGRLTRSYQVALGCRTLGILLASDVRIVDALVIVAESTEHPLYKESWLVVSERVQAGQRLSLELRAYPKLFPPVVVQLIQAGETTGNLSYMLGYLSDMYEEEVRDITKNMTTLLEPILMLVMGLIVGFIAVSIITPIYGITQHLHG